MTNVRRAALLLLCGALVFGFNTARAQGAPKIGFVNFPAIVDQAPQTEQLMIKLRDEFAPRQRALVALQQELQDKSETYQRDSSVMGESERLALEREIQQGTRDLQRSNTELQEDFNIRQNEELGVLQRTLVEQVQEYVRGAGYDLVVTDVVYVSGALDITEDVIAALLVAQSEAAGAD
jgi:outer membrane protein